MLTTVLRPIEIVIRRVERELAGPEDDGVDDVATLAAALERSAAAIDRHARALERLGTSLAPMSGLTEAIEHSTAAASTLRDTLAATAETGGPPPPAREGRLGLRRQRTSPTLRPDPEPGF